jgi:hypothetical protein
VVNLAEIRAFLWPEGAERADGFRAEVERLGRRGLRVIGWIEIVMSLLGTAICVAAENVKHLASYLLPSLITMVVGVLKLGSAETLRGSEYTRVVGMESGFAAVAWQAS